MFVKRIALLLLTAALADMPACAAPESWVEVKSSNFVVISNGNEKQARHTAGQLERMRWIFQTLFPTSDTAPAPPIVALAVKDRKSMRTLEPASYLAPGQLDLAGLFLNSSDKSYILLRFDAEGEHPFATIYHEYTHWRVRKTADWLPLWVNEGLAEFFQNTEIENKYALMGEPSPGDILYLRQNRLLPLTTLFQVDSKSPYYHEEQKGSMFYAESWALVHYLQIQDFPTHAHRLDDYLELVSRNVDSVKAAQRAFGDLRQLQTALELYVAQGNFQEFKAAVLTNVDETAFQSRALSEPQADAVRADFLARDGRTKDALALAQNVLSQDPENTQAKETMGFLAFSAGDRPEALKWYTQAVQTGSENYLSHYYFATMTIDAGKLSEQDATAVEKSLRRAIELNPSFAPGYDALAVFYGRQNTNLAEAHTMDLRAVSLDPGNLNYRLNTASILQQMNDEDSALRVLQAARTMAKTSAEQSIVESRIELVTQLQQAKAEEKAREAGASGSSVAPAQPNGDQPIQGRLAPGQVIVVGNRGTAVPKHPDETPHGPTHVAKGVVRSATCSYPSVLEMTLASGTKTLAFYSNNYYKVDFSATNFIPPAKQGKEGDFDPCTGLDGLKALIEYAETSDKEETGQIVSIILTK